MFFFLIFVVMGQGIFEVINRSAAGHRRVCFRLPSIAEARH